MTTPRVTVPVEPTEAMLKAWDDYRHHASGVIAWRAMLSAALSPEAPAREGEGVAMGADDVEHRLPEVEGFGASYDRGHGKWILYSMPGAKPFGAVDGYDRTSLDFVVNALRSALTPRHEAPAEAGEPSLVDWFSQFIERHQEGCGSDTDALIACLDRVRDSYRAQPQAREDALPDAGARLARAMWGVDLVPAAKTAPDALRVAVEALEKISNRRSIVFGRGEMSGQEAFGIATEALAALQAEQKGGA